MKRILYVLLLLCIMLQMASCGTYESVHHRPPVVDYNTTVPTVEKHNDSTYTFKNNFLIKNRYGLWEMYVEGDPYQRGMISGALAHNLILHQEDAFMAKVKEIVPSKFKQSVLRQFLKWYNRKLHEHVPEEYLAEIYGISQYASKEYDYVAPPYLRSLYLHAAHDIGHALTDLSMVGCTSFAVRDDKTQDGSLLIARNLDFYAGDEFAEDKIIAFIKPDTGYPFMSVVWGGMIGNLSGMNTKGLTVTINSGKSDIPLQAKTPISILSREILQYAQNIDEAVAIAKKREVFVSESIMVGSAQDHRAVLIEVSPNKFGVYEVPNSSQLICSNHFQSEAYSEDENNEYAIENSHSQYRYEKMTELLDTNEKVNPEDAAAIMRNTEGLNGIALGYGNEKAINQLLAHHSVIFKPEQRIVWVSANPYQLGEYVAYNLDDIFNKPHVRNLTSMAVERLTIAADPFLYTDAYKNYKQYRKEDRIIDAAIENKETLPLAFIETYQSYNPDFWEVYYKAGVYNYNRGYYTAAKAEFEKALTKEITTVPDREQVEDYLMKIKRKLK